MIKYRRFMCQGELCRLQYMPIDAEKPYINFCDLPDNGENRYLKLPDGWHYYPLDQHPQTGNMGILRCPRCVIHISMKHPDTECRLCGSPGYFMDECLVWIPHACPDGRMHEELNDGI